MEPVYGVINKKGDWAVDNTGRVMVFLDKRIANAQAVSNNADMSGGPFEARAIGTDGKPLENVTKSEAKK